MERIDKKENTENRPSKKKAEISERKKPINAQKNKTKVRKKKRRKLTKEEIRLREKKRRKKNLIDIIKFSIPILITTILVFLFILNTSAHMVEGDSMNPTLKNKDRVIVRRTKEINRYDVITFKPPVESEFQYVKRVIGMPGDLIWLEADYLLINQQTTTVPRDLTSTDQLPDGTVKLSISKEAAEQFAGLGKIPKGFYFVLGDNRENSSDSREFGLVNNSSIEGVVSFRFAPFGQMSWIK